MASPLATITDIFIYINYIDKDFIDNLINDKTPDFYKIRINLDNNENELNILINNAIIINNIISIILKLILLLLSIV